MSFFPAMLSVKYLYTPLYKDGFQWINGKEVDYENWTPDRDMAGGCGEMRGATGQWDDVSCGTQQGYVCRWQEDGDYTTVPTATTTSTTTTPITTTTPTTTTSPTTSVSPSQGRYIIQ